MQDSQEELQEDIQITLLGNKESAEDDEQILEEQLEEPLEEEPSISFVPFYEELYDSDVISVNPEDYEDSAQGFQQLITDEVELRISNFIETLPEKAKEIINLAANGVDIESYLRTEEVDYANIDIDDEDNQILAITEILEIKGLSDTRIQSYLSKLTSDELKDEALDALNELVVIQENKKEELITQAKDNEVQTEQLKEQEIEDIISNITSIDSIDGFKIDSDEKQRLIDYTTVHVAQDKNGNLLTQYELNSLNLSDKLRIAFHSMREFTNYESVERNIKTNVTKSIKENLQRLNTPNYKSGANINKNKITLPTIEYNED